ncbi:MAG: nickel-dependent lactate racemase [Candidatus Hodarchaeota archaeon]
MKCHLEYGKTGLNVDLPEHNLIAIAQPKNLAGVADEAFSIAYSIKNPIQTNPLHDIITSSQDKVLIAVSDVTRPTPVAKILLPLFAELKRMSIPDKNITIIIANGLHRNATEAELEWLIGKQIFERVKVINHEALKNSRLVEIGFTSYGTRLQVNDLVREADIKICVDYCEPHFFAGFSGGRKTILPGIAGKDTILQIHRPELIDHPKVCNGVVEDNPLHYELVEAARMVGVDFIVNTVMNEHNKILCVASGDLEAAHYSLIKTVLQTRSVEIPHKAEIVITTNGGWPLDQNFYQSIKGLGVVTRLERPIIKEGGVIILVTRCEEGFGRHTTWIKRLGEAASPIDFIEQLYASEYKPVVDDWQAQVLARILEKYEVIIISEGLRESEISSCHMTYAQSVEHALDLAKTRVGRDAGIVVLPNGPAVLPLLL